MAEYGLEQDTDKTRIMRRYPISVNGQIFEKHTEVPGGSMAELWEGRVYAYNVTSSDILFQHSNSSRIPLSPASEPMYNPPYSRPRLTATHAKANIFFARLTWRAGQLVTSYLQEQIVSILHPVKRSAYEYA